MSELDPISVDIDYSTEPYTSPYLPRPLSMVGGRLFDYLVELDARVSALEQFESGTYVTVSGSWQVNPQANAQPGGRQVTCNTGVFSTSNLLRFDKFNQQGTDMTDALMNCTRIYGRMKRDSTNWVAFTVGGAASDEGSYVEVPVSHDGSGGSINSAQWQDAVIVFQIPTSAP